MLRLKMDGFIPFSSGKWDKKNILNILLILSKSPPKGR